MGTTEGESRVLLNFGHTFDSVSTLAHELGHAYHNTTLALRTPLQRSTPMALAETASIFCETLLTQSVLAATTDPARRLAILDYDLQGACQVVVDIHSRFLFETEVFDRRRHRTFGRPRPVRADARRPAPLVRRRARRRAPPPVHVGGQAPLLLDPFLQLALYLWAALRPRSVCRLPGRSRSVSGRLRRPAGLPPGWRTPPAWRPASASTWAGTSSGPPACRCWRDGSTSSRSWRSDPDRGRPPPPGAGPGSARRDDEAGMSGFR